MTIGGLTVYEVATYFILYSFLGWILEVVYHAAGKGQIVNRGFLNGPVCPIYGIGVVAIFMLLNTVSAQGIGKLYGLYLFLGGMLLATLIELIGGWALDKLFHARWWDYSDKPLNLHGYICPEFSLYWGLAIVFVVRVLHPFVESHTVALVPERYGWPVLGVLGAAYLADIVVTVAIVRGLNKRLEELDDIRASMRIVSDNLSEALGEGSLRTKQNLDRGKVQVSLAKTELKEQADQTRAELKEQVRQAREDWQSQTEEWKKRQEEQKQDLQKRAEALYTRILSGRVFGSKRLLRAFPSLRFDNHEELAEILRKRLRG